MCVCAQSCLTRCDPVDCSPPGSSVHSIFRQGCWSGLPFPLLGDLPNPGIKLASPVSPVSPVLAGGFSTTWATFMFLTFREKCWGDLKFQKSCSIQMKGHYICNFFFFILDDAFWLVFQVTKSLLLYVIFVKFFYKFLKFNYFFRFYNFHFLIYRKSISGLIFHLFVSLCCLFLCSLNILIS